MKPKVWVIRKEVTLIPFYNTYDQYYTVYWDVFSPGNGNKKQAEYEAERLRIEELNKVTVDYIVLGEMQPERDHNLSAGESRIGDFRGKNTGMLIRPDILISI